MKGETLDVKSEKEEMKSVVIYNFRLTSHVSHLTSNVLRTKGEK